MGYDSGFLTTAISAVRPPHLGQNFVSTKWPQWEHPFLIERYSTIPPQLTQYGVFDGKPHFTHLYNSGIGSTALYFKL